MSECDRVNLLSFKIFSSTQMPILPENGVFTAYGLFSKVAKEN